MWKLNGKLLSAYGIIPGQVANEGLAIKGIFDLPRRIGTIYNDWDEDNSVDPYVDADELFYEGRNIAFQGILEGTLATIQTNIDTLKTDISNLNALTPFETPYGTYCVYVDEIRSELHNGIATVLIIFREPQIGAACSINSAETLYYSQVYTESTNKNNCDDGYYGLPVSLSSTYGQFTSNISQEAADQLAVNWVRENMQLNANLADSVTYCEVNPAIYYNQEQTKSLQKDDCPTNFTGSQVSYTIEADAYSSEISQADADAQAIAALDQVLTQAYANSRGTCQTNDIGHFTKTKDILVTDDGSFYDARIQYFQVGVTVPEGATYHFLLYGIEITYTALAGDDQNTVANIMCSRISNTTAAEWRAENQAPVAPYTAGFKPTCNTYNNQVAGELRVIMPRNAGASVWTTAAP